MSRWHVLILRLGLLVGAVCAGGLAARPQARPQPLPKNVLRVGVRQLPVNLSPALAWTDNELRVVDLLFEGLMRQVPGPDGSVVYRPALAVAPPELVPPLGRTFLLPEMARWSDDQSVSSADIRETYRMLRAGNLGLSPAYAERLEEPNPRDVNSLTLKLTQGVLEPQAFLTFKIVPAPTAQDPARDPGSKEFAAHPVGSGRFRLKEIRKDAVILEANPSYQRRPGKEQLPPLNEIHFLRTIDPGTDLRNGKIDLALDLAPADLAKLPGFDVLPRKGQRVSNRRIYFLALNHTGALGNVSFRRALAHALPVEDLLDRFYRGDQGRAHDPVLHSALTWKEKQDMGSSTNLRTSPFPRGSWPTNPPASGVASAGDLENMKKELGLKETALKLDVLYPDDDPILEEIVKELTEKDREGAKKLFQGAFIELVPHRVSPGELRTKVEARQYQAAFYHYDYPDDTFWLRPLLGPAGPHGAGNIFDYRDPKFDNLLQNIDKVRNFRSVRELMQEAHAKFALDVPFIPLWQLDSCLAIGPGVTPREGFDPLYPFADPDRWGKTP
jgi:ABC-type transport system substrate-binding protein